MSLFENIEHLKLLRNLLNPEDSKDDGSDLEEEGEPLIKQNLNPGNLVPPHANAAGEQTKTFKSPYAPLEEDDKLKSNSKQPSTIEEWHEQQEREDVDILESRKCPEYRMTYRQAVGTEDIYLAMGNRTNASASCEDLVVEILLPGDSTPADKMQLSITTTEVDLATPIYRLKLPLSQPVNVDRCRAKYDKDMEKLTLTLRLQRELDFVNF
ncbi:dynein axonemal assembly factor 6-like [Musca domestica]|uniref:Dynein axonemal assembly factor 6-like n=1 Tax=Musca domestica TaxID=7370 RepID=A0A1I8MM61_MUSDO|nr:dynein axonemal assembly factor 6-like [Musca domestica]